MFMHHFCKEKRKKKKKEFCPIGNLINKFYLFIFKLRIQYC